jgi:hypothetical protein
MGHSVDSNITNRYIDAFPLARQYLLLPKK